VHSCSLSVSSSSPLSSLADSTSNCISRNGRELSRQVRCNHVTIGMEFIILYYIILYYSWMVYVSMCRASTQRWVTRRWVTDIRVSFECCWRCWRIESTTPRDVKLSAEHDVKWLWTNCKDCALITDGNYIVDCFLIACSVKCLKEQYTYTHALYTRETVTTWVTLTRLTRRTECVRYSSITAARGHRVHKRPESNAVVLYLRFIVLCLMFNVWF